MKNKLSLKSVVMDVGVVDNWTVATYVVALITRSLGLGRGFTPQRPIVEGGEIKKNKVD
jgi:hypothetical protein